MTVANADQHEAWNGESGHRWVATAERRDAVLAPIANVLGEIAAIGAGQRVLDLGCGCGATTLAAAVATGPRGAVVGVDLSAPMLGVARHRAHGHPNVEFHQADAQTDPLGGPFDVAISRFGTMFFDDPVAAFANVAHHLSPHGRLCIATWQPLEANEWLVVPITALLRHGSLPDGLDPAKPGMFAQSDPEGIRRTLTDAGFVDARCEAHTVGLDLGRSIDDALEYLADTGPGRGILATMPADRHPEALDAVRDALAAHHEPDRGVVLGAGIWVTTARAATTPNAGP
jgi:ubiquinone/menaquinone biosynthesis C-methylase UbiE